MALPMRKFFGPAALLVLFSVALTGCGNRETREALQKAGALEKQQQYQEADETIVAAEKAREAKIRAKLPAPTDATGADEVTKQVQSDPEILKMERAQIPLYLHWGRPDLASAVYTDILTGAPDDRTVFPLVQDPDPAIRTGAVRVLGLASEARAIDTLAAATHDSNQDVRRAAVAALGTIKNPATVPPLIDALKDSYWFVRSDAANALGVERDARAVKPLLDLTNDSDSTVQSSAENALIDLAATKAAPDDLAARLDDANPRTATVAAVCLALEKDPRSLAPLLKLAASADPKLRLNAVKALGDLGDPAGLPVLRSGLKDPDLNVRGSGPAGSGAP
jgi:hypothetical protein